MNYKDLINPTLWRKQMIKMCELSETEKDLLFEHVESAFVRACSFAGHYFTIHKKTEISIRVSLKKLRDMQEPYQIVTAKASLHRNEKKGNTLELDCFVACNKEFLECLPKDEDEIDLIQHLDSLPKPEGDPKIQLVTCQNGIQNSFATSKENGDFQKMCKSIREKLVVEKPLFIGIYNPTSGKTHGILSDVERLKHQWTLNMTSIMMLRQLFFTLANRLTASKQLWAHVAHSEAGIIVNNCLTDPRMGLASSQKKVIKKQLITLVYGGVMPVPDEACDRKYNTYSNKDIALLLVKKHLAKIPPNLPYTSKNNGYTIDVVESQGSNFPPVVGDHAFLGKTYQDALDKNFDELRDKGLL